MSKAKLGDGNVDFELDGKPVTLKPSLRAAQTISRQAGGIGSALEAVGRMDVDVITGLVALGLGKEPKDVAEKVWRTGYPKVSPHVIRFLSVIANGGRLPTEGGEGDEDPQEN
jgi:hypothetical protein